MTPHDITNERRLANYLGMELSQIKILYENNYVINDYCNKIFNQDFDNSILNVDKFCIPKRIKKLGYREIYKPTSDTLVNCLITLNKKFNNIYIAPISVNGFVKGRGIKLNAQKHLGKKFILSIDINNFFETINSCMVVENLERYGFKNDIALKIANIVTINNRLVQGFHTSPTLANIIFENIDFLLDKIDSNLTYSRYADDLTFSSNYEITAYSKIKDLIEKFGFTVNERKTKIMKRGENQYVTGLTVFDENYPRISKKVKKRLRLEIYYINKFGIRNHVLKKLNINKKDYFNDLSIKKNADKFEDYTLSRLFGWLYYIKGIEPVFYKKYFDLLKMRKQND